MRWSFKNSKIKIDEKDKLKILTVKAVEENGNNFFNQLAISKANIISISAKSDEEFILKRARYLFSLLPEALKSVTNISNYKKHIFRTVFIIALITGLFSNYIGSTKDIHIIYNPLTILLIWNLLVYFILAIEHFFHFNLSKQKTKKKRVEEEKNDHNESETTVVNNKQEKPNFLVRWISGWFFKRAIILKTKYDDKKTKARIIKNIITPLWHDYLDIAGKSLTYRFKSFFHIGSIGLVLGALLGIYFRGLFFKYNIVWQSTFISDISTIKILVNVLFGFANLLLHGKLITNTDIEMLMMPGGVSAASWIHLMAVTSIIYVVIPRSLLVLYNMVKEKTTIRDIEFKTPYYQEYILKHRESIGEAVKSGISEIIEKKIKLTALKIADFVVQDYFDNIIVPILLSFRKNGGKIKELENALFKSQEKFEPILMDYLSQVQDDFKESVLAEINLFLGRNFDFDINTESSYQPKTSEIDKQLSGKLASEIGDTISGTFVTGVAITAGTLSGGIGKSLGIAILSTLLGVSGPVGLLIGGLVTAASLGGVYKMKRDKVTEMVKEIPLPAFAVAITLSDSKIEKTRKDTYQHTLQEITKVLKPKIDEVTEKILQEIIS